MILYQLYLGNLPNYIVSNKRMGIFELQKSSTRRRRRYPRDLCHTCHCVSSAETGVELPIQEPVRHFRFLPLSCTNPSSCTLLSKMLFARVVNLSRGPLNIAGNTRL